MHAFNYHKPTSLADVLSTAAKHADGKILAGGQSLVQAMKLRLASPTDLIDLGGIKDLASIKAAGAPIAPASPQPFTPSGLCVQAVTRVSIW